jgi:EPS-associated MarR family transcriptional regulator
MSKTLDQETHYQILSLLEQNPELSQRQLAAEMGVSVGKINYCIRALLDVGHVKLNNFARSKNKIGYAYVLTPKGFKEKAIVTVRFLELKQVQYQQLKKEIAELKKETEANDKSSKI